MGEDLHFIVWMVEFVQISLEGGFELNFQFALADGFIQNSIGTFESALEIFPVSVEYLIRLHWVRAVMRLYWVRAVKTKREGTSVNGETSIFKSGFERGNQCVTVGTDWMRFGVRSFGGEDVVGESETRSVGDLLDAMFAVVK